MAKLKTWIKASRPRTLLLSFSGVLLGAFLAIAKVPEPVEGPTFWFTLVFCALTATLLQVLSNLANDYGDFKKGTDSAKRVGPMREMQSGSITEKEMHRGIAVVSALCLLFGGILIFVLARLTWQELAVFAALGLGAVFAAVLYTLGRHPYGYRGLGDLFCFLFFGWAAVAGTFYLATKTLDFLSNSNAFSGIQMMFLAAWVIALALLVVGLVRWCAPKRDDCAFLYHCLLIVGAFVCFTVFLILKHAPVYAYMFLWLFIVFFKDLRAIKNTQPEQLDPFLGRQVKHTFLLVVVYGVLLLV